MTTLDDLIAQKAALVEALGSGAVEVQHGDKRVRYRDIAQLKEALAEINRQIIEAGGSKRRRQIRIYSTMGR
jgi:hypothetical protein